MRKRTVAHVLSLGLLVGTASAVNALEARPGTGMLVIAHRGAPVYAAESTIGGYQRAADLGADLLEGDMVMSKDGVLVMCHDLDLQRVTDIASRPEFAARKTTREFNGVTYEGWWVDEFTVPELKQLRKWDGQQLATLDEFLEFSQGRGASAYIEIKESEYFTVRGLDPVATLVGTLRARGLDRRESPLWVQSSTESDLRALRGQVPNRLVYLTRDVGVDESGVFPTYRQFADVLGIPTNKARRQLVREAHAADLGVHIWTLRGSRDAYRKAASIGADGVITDFPDLGVDVRGRLRSASRPSGLSARVENGNAVATWSADGSWYAVTFDFGDPLMAPTIWTNQGSATIPMADATSVDVTVSRFDGARLGADAFARAEVTARTYSAPTVRTRVSELRAVLVPGAKTRIVGRFERKKGNKWVPLRKAKGWLLGQGEDVSDVRRSFRSTKKGEFSLAVQVRDDIVAGYVPQRSWRVGVTANSRLKPSASDWTVGEEGPPPEPAKKRKTRSLQKKDVRIRRK